MPTRKFELSEDQAEFVDENVTSGRFRDADEVVREGLRLLDEQQREDERKLAALKAAIEVGRQAAREGRVVEIEPGRELEYLQGLGRTGKRPA